MPISKVVYGNQVVIDITDTTATPSDVMYGKYFYMPDGSKVEGTGSGGGGIVVVETTDEHGGTIVDITGEVIRLQTKTATPSSEQIYVTPDSGYIGLGSVIVQAIPSEYNRPTGTINITENGIIDVAAYASANVNVNSQPEISLQSKSVDPSENAQIVTADAGYTALSTVYVGAVSSTYVGSDIIRRAASDLTANNSVINVPSGYYQVAVSSTVKAGSATTPTKTISITPEITLTSSTGVISVNVSGSSSISPTVSAGWVSAGIAGTVSVSGSSNLNLTTQAAKTVTPTESEQTAVAAYRYTTGAVKVGAVSSTYVGSGIAKRSSSDLTVSGATVTIPSGYYSSNASKSVSSMTLPTSTSNNATSGYTSKATIARSSSNQYINIPAGYNSSGAYYLVSAVPNGSATGPSQLSETSATVSTGTNTLTLTKTNVTTTPTVTPGYVPNATTSTATVTLTANVTTKSAETFTPTTSNQTIPSKTYLTGAQTIQGDANLVGTNIVSGVSIFGVQGQATFQTYYTGSSVPASSLGNNGDIYLQA